MTAVRERPHFVYRVYGARRRLLYVGCTSNLALRKRNHRQCAEWYPLAKRWRIDGPFDYETARRLELDAIKTERPRFNLTGRRANFIPRRRSA